MTASLAPAGWADLPLDLLGNVSDRLRDAADFVRFHTVCKPWRDTAALTPNRPAFPPTRPWILAPCNGVISQYPFVNLRRVSPEAAPTTLSCYRRRYYMDVLPGASSPLLRAGDRNWVASADGIAIWLFTGTTEPKLTDLLTGVVSLLPPFPDDDDEIKRPLERPRGIVYGDGTVMLYSFFPEFYFGHLFTAAILHPGDTAWTVVKKRLHVVGSYCFGATYHRDDGKLLLWNGECCYVLTLNPEANNNGGSVITSEDKLKVTQEYTVEIGGRRYIHDYSYCLVSHGELLWASILLEQGWYHGYIHDDPTPGTVSLAVYALERAVLGGDMMQWVKKDGRSLCDRIMFLGTPASFTVDVAPLGVSGGYAYFVFKHGVYNCNLVDGEAKLVTEKQERLRLDWGADKIFMWLQHQPSIAPIQEIRERIEASKEKSDFCLLC